jgi:CRP-like cAMP-binding protein
MQHDAIVGALADCAVFDSLKASQLHTLAKRVQVLTLPEGETLFREGDIGDTLYFLLAGECAVVKEDGIGGQLPLATVSSGRVIGEMAIVDNAPRSATVRANKPTRLLALDRETFDELTESRPDIAVPILRNVARMLSLNLRHTSGRLTSVRT